MTEKINSNVLSTGKGYWVSIPKKADGTYNAWLTSVDGKKRFPLWIYEIGIGFSLNGTTAQSQQTRTFFPRSFSQPSIVVRGQTFDQKMYRDLGEFVRAQQLKAIRLSRAMGFTLPRAGGSIAGRQRGPRDGISAEGYVLSMDTGAGFGEFAPEYEFAFAISRSRAGVLGWDRAAAKRRIKTWAEIFRNMNKSEGFVNDPDNEWLEHVLESVQREKVR